jgi:hypothetical protein
MWKEFVGFAPPLPQRPLCQPFARHEAADFQGIREITLSRTLLSPVSSVAMETSETRVRENGAAAWLELIDLTGRGLPSQLPVDPCAMNAEEPRGIGNAASRFPERALDEEILGAGQIQRESLNEGIE